MVILCLNIRSLSANADALSHLPLLEKPDKYLQPTTQILPFQPNKSQKPLTRILSYLQSLSMWIMVGLELFPINHTWVSTLRRGTVQFRRMPVVGLSRNHTWVTSRSCASRRNCSHEESGPHVCLVARNHEWHRPNRSRVFALPKNSILRPLYTHGVGQLGPGHVFTLTMEGKMVLVMIDTHSKWIEAIHTSTASSDAIIETCRERFAQFGLPETVVTDNSTCSEFEAFLKRMALNTLLPHPTIPLPTDWRREQSRLWKLG